MMILKRTEYFRRSNTGRVPNLMTAPGDGGVFFWEWGSEMWISRQSLRRLKMFG